MAKIAGKPLHRLLAERYNDGRSGDKVFCYVGGGWYFPGQTLADLQDEMRRHLDAGYTMVKMKVGGLPLDEDLRRIEAVLEVVGSGSRLAVDANANSTATTRSPTRRRSRPTGCAGSRSRATRSTTRLFAELAGEYAGPLATGENLYSTQDVENLVRFGGLRADRDIIQVDPPQAYGIAQYARTLAMLAGRGWPRSALFPHGGNQMSLHIAGGFGLGGAESYPGVFGDFGGFADDARVEDGYLKPARAAGHRLRGAGAPVSHHARVDRIAAQPHC